MNGAPLLGAGGMYPNLGVDDRSQFELIESLPGGIAGQKKLVSQMHARGVRVLYPYGMPRKCFSCRRTQRGV